MNKYQFANYIYEQRKQLGLSQKELASMLGVTNKSVSKWETGAALPRTNTLVQLAEIFGVSVEELFVEEEKQTPSVNIITAESIDRQLNEKLNTEKIKRMAEYKISKKEAKLYLCLLVMIFLLFFVLAAVSGIVLDMAELSALEPQSFFENIGFGLIAGWSVCGMFTGIVVFARLLKRIPLIATVFMVLLFPLTIVIILSFGVCFIIPAVIKCVKVIKERENG